MVKIFIAVGLAIYLLLLVFIFVDLAYVYQYYSIHPAQAIPLALGVELLAAYFSAVAIYYRNRILKSVAVLFALFVWFLVMTATTKLWTQVTMLSIAITLFVPFGNLVLPSIIAYLLQLYGKVEDVKHSIEETTQQNTVEKVEETTNEIQPQTDEQSENSDVKDVATQAKNRKSRRQKVNITYNVVGPLEVVRLIETDLELRQYVDILSRHILKKVNVFEIRDGNIVDNNRNPVHIRRNLLKKRLLSQLNGIKIQRVAS